jgi:sec-independent protein translocase protein TatB
MDFLGVGPLELILIIVLALVLVGPRDMARLGRDAGRFLNRLYRSPAWRTMNDASRELRNLPTRLAREAELDTLQRDLEQAGQGLQQDVQAASEGMSAWTTPAARPALPPALPGQPAASPGELPKPEKAPDPPASESPFAEG